MKLEFDAHAKINLSLLITGKADGYHLLDSVVTTVSLCDRITLTDGGKTPTATFLKGLAEPPEQTAHTLAALKGLQKLLGCKTCLSANIVKNIPDRAGLGGSSAECAGLIRAACLDQGISTDDPRVKALAAECGSDVSVMLNHGTFRMRGRGCEVEKLVSPAVLHAVLIYKGVVDTSEAFRLYDRGVREIEDNRALIETLACGRLPGQSMIVNDLLPSALALCPDLQVGIDRLRAVGARAVGLTGSGSGLFGLFESEKACRSAIDQIDKSFHPTYIFSL